MIHLFTDASAEQDDDGVDIVNGIVALEDGQLTGNRGGRVLRQLALSLLPWLALALAYGFVGDHVDNAAHLGGLGVGLTLGAVASSPLLGGEPEGTRWVPVVALNLAPTTPQWLVNIGGKPMKLGLDLRGGVHFLMEVDMASVVRRAEERRRLALRRQPAVPGLRQPSATSPGHAPGVRGAAPFISRGGSAAGTAG